MPWRSAINLYQILKPKIKSLAVVKLFSNMVGISVLGLKPWITHALARCNQIVPNSVAEDKVARCSKIVLEYGWDFGAGIETMHHPCLQGFDLDLV